jgi:hypothetical protein
VSNLFVFFVISCFSTASPGEEERKPRRAMGVRGSASSPGPTEVRQFRHNQGCARPRCQCEDDHWYILLCIWLSNSTLSTSFRLNKGERFRLTCSDNVMCR